jgi:hypothetical protein
MTYTAVNPHACCNRPRPEYTEDAHAAARPPPHPHASPHLTNSDGLCWKTDGRPPANGPPTATPQQRRHSPSTPARGPPRPPHTPTEPTADATTRPKPRSSSHYGTEFARSHTEGCLGRSASRNSSRVLSRRCFSELVPLIALVSYSSCESPSSWCGLRVRTSFCPSASHKSSHRTLETSL